MTVYAFDLLHEAWLPVRTLDGSPAEVGLREALCNAHDYTGLADPSPMVTLALHRLLLAIAHRAMNGPESHAAWMELWRARRLPADAVSAYLNAHADRFDLFHAEHPFFQVAGLQTIDKNGATPASPVGRLEVTAATGNNAVLFSHEQDRHPRRWPAAVAARHLVCAQATALGGGKGPTTNVFGPHPYTSHATQVGGVGVLLAGRTLAETLILNLVRYDAERPLPKTADDRPIWERDAYRPPGEHFPDGYVDYLTFPSRYARLIPAGAGSSPEVDGVYIAPGLSLPREGGPLNPLWAYRIIPSSPQPVPVPMRQHRALWRDSTALFQLPAEGRDDLRPLALREASSPVRAALLSSDARLAIRCFGLANDKAKALAWTSEELPARVRLLRDVDMVVMVEAALDAAERTWSALRRALRQLAREVLETEQKSAAPDDIGRLANRMLSRCGFWADLDAPFHRFLEHLDDDEDEALAAWTALLLDVAHASFRRAVPFAQGPLDRRARAEAVAERALGQDLHPLRLHTPAAQEDAT